ncbi:hypothetical protein DsansV1_C09g0091831 [Dioscorea sansibarensis]
MAKMKELDDDEYKWAVQHDPHTWASQPVMKHLWQAELQHTMHILSQVYRGWLLAMHKGHLSHHLVLTISKGLGNLQILQVNMKMGHYICRRERQPSSDHIVLYDIMGCK